MGHNIKSGEKAQRNMYSLSMCKLEAEAELTLWRLYADDTKGIGLIFKIAGNPLKWKHYHLRQIYYGKIEKLEEFKRKKIQFEEREKFKFHIALDRFLGFHKSEKYSIEQEIRLLYINPEYNKRFHTFPHRKRISELSEYIILDIGISTSDTSGDECDLEKPTILLEEIVLGPNFTNSDFIKTAQKNFPNIKIRKSTLEGLYRSG